VQPWPQIHLAETIAIIPFVWLTVRLFAASQRTEDPENVGG
jgi:hypothetical protein